MNKLLEHFKRMQECAAAYLVPETYNARYPAGIHKSAESYSEARDRLFADDILYMLDGPEQREAEASVGIADPLAVTIRNIERWAYDRNLVNGATSQAQMLKTTEEVGELAGAIARGKRDSIIDGIGDVVVTLVILAEQNGLEFADCVAAAYDEIKDRKGVMRDGIFIKEE